MSLMHLLMNQGAPSGVLNIDVTGNMPATKENIPELPDTRPVIDRTDTEEHIPREGLFGVKGTLRDVLGTLGDAFLIQSGNAPMYGPQRDRERVGEAMTNFATNPLEAIQRIAAMGYPDEAQELYAQHQRDVLTKQQRDTQAKNAEGLAETRRQNLIKGVSGEIRNTLYRLPPERRFEYLSGLNLPGNLTLQDLGILSDDSEELDNWILAGVPITQAEKFIRTDRGQDQRDRSLDQADRRIGVSEARAAEVVRANRAREEDRDYSNETSRIRATKDGDDNTPRLRSRGERKTNFQSPGGFNIRRKGE